MENNCYNCKHKMDATCSPIRKTNNYCKKQQAWIFAPLRKCPKFEISFWSRIFGDRTPFIRTEKLVGGCEED